MNDEVEDNGGLTTNLPSAPEPVFNDKGMKPGIFNGRRIHPKMNTAAPRSKKRLERAQAGWEKHLENNPRDVMAQKCLSNVKEKLRSFA